MQFGPYPITLRQLQYILAVADLRNFRRAAERCMVSQPSLSGQLAEAESALGVKLFERDRRRVLITAAGRDIVAHAERILLEFEESLETARRHLDPLKGRLRLGVIPTIAPYLLPELDPAFRQAFPELSLVWIEDKTEVLVERIQQGHMDAAVLALEADLADLDYDIIGSDPFVFATNPEHELAVEGPISLDLLDEREVLLLDDGHCFRDQALAFCATAGAREMGFRATSMATLCQMVAGGNAVTLLPRMALEVENRRALLNVRPFLEPVPARTIVIVRRRDSAINEALTTLGTVARELCEERKRTLPLLAD